MTSLQYRNTAAKLVPEHIAGRDILVNNIALAIDDAAQGRSVEAIKQGDKLRHESGPSLMSITLFDLAALWFFVTKPAGVFTNYAFIMADEFIFDRAMYLESKESQATQPTEKDHSNAKESTDSVAAGHAGAN